MLSTKNAGLAASADLGLGDQLQAQVADDIAQRRKKLLQMAGAAQKQGPLGIGPATASLFNMEGNQYG